MVRSFKLLSLIAAIAVVMMAASGTSKADSIQLGGLISFTPIASSHCTSSPSGCQDVTFGSLSVLATDPVETINNFSVSFPSFALGVSGSAATFNPTSGPLSVSINGSTLTGSIAWEGLMATGTGGFQLDVGLNGLTGGGSDSVLQSFALNGGGSGILTFQFTAANLSSIAGLVDSTVAIPNNSVSATLTTPEPASLGLFGIGLLGLALVYRRRLKALV